MVEGEYPKYGGRKANTRVHQEKKKAAIEEQAIFTNKGSPLPYPSNLLIFQICSHCTWPFVAKRTQRLCKR